MSELVLAYLRVLVWRAAVGFGLWIGRGQVQTGLSHLAERIRHVTSPKAGRAEVTIGDQLEALQVELDETEIKAKNCLQQTIFRSLIPPHGSAVLKAVDLWCAN